MGLIAKPGNGHLSAASPWAHGRDRSARGFSMAMIVFTRRPISQTPTSRARRPVGAIAGGWAHSASAATLRTAASLRSLGSPRARWGVSRGPPHTLALISSALHRAFVSSLASHRRRPSANPGWRVGGARSESAQAQPYCPRLESAESRRAACTPQRMVGVLCARCTPAGGRCHCWVAQGCRWEPQARRGRAVRGLGGSPQVEKVAFGCLPPGVCLLPPLWKNPLWPKSEVAPEVASMLLIHY